MRAYVAGIVRSANGLDTLTYEVSDLVDRERPWRRVEVYARCPLAQGARRELWTAWRALESVSDWSATTLERVLVILRETVPCSDVPRDLPALGPEVRPRARPRATAAHPRAFRGTKYRPPKARQADVVDLRPYLLTRRHTDQILELLGQPRGIDPYVAWNHGVDASASFDPAFVTHLLPLYRGCRWSDVSVFASLARALELHVRPELRAALVGVYLTAGDTARALAWWSHVLAHDPDRRLEVAQLVSTSGVAARPAIEPGFAAQIAHLAMIQRWSIYRGLAAGASPAYLLAGLQLGAISSTKIEPVPPGRQDVASIIESTVTRLDQAMEEDSGPEFWRPYLWRVCGQQPELIDLLGTAEFAALRPAAAFWLVRLACSPRWCATTAEQRWSELAPHLPPLLERAARLPPEYQRKFIEDMGDVYGWTLDHGHDLADALSRCVELCLRVARPPFITRSVLGDTLLAMTLIFADASRAAERRAIYDAPDASWLALEAACERVNRARLLDRGLDRMSRFVPELLASTFTTAPGALLQAADALAAVSFETAAQLLKAYAASPIADPAVSEAPIERLCSLIAPIAAAGGHNPVRRAVRRHVAGEHALSDAQLRGHRERIVAELGVVRLAAIRQSVERALAARVGQEKIETPTLRHAVAMIGHADEQRRQLRRMVLASVAGDPQWRLRHPRTQAWFARHPRLDRDAWLTGVALRGEIAGIGKVQIAIETDPLEALKLGTYVGSCLGRGGNLEYAAAAVVLDANKQVVYARDEQGSVIGRQLLAISESDELVCFPVYGTVKRELLQPLFRDYDLALASKLALSIFGTSSTSDTYEIDFLLSHTWWDDRPWEIEFAACPPRSGPE